jgi:molybdopterin converting factor subunit 1
MQVRLLFFGMLKEVAGRDHDLLDLPEGARVADLLQRYGSRSPKLASYFDVIAVAVNHEYAGREAALHDRDEVALIPPVSGGVSGPAAAALPSPHATIVREPIPTAAIVDSIKRPADGAVAVFEGIVRDHSRNRRTLYLDYEAYEPMALKQMETLAGRALAQFKVRDIALAHRLGRLQIGETSVLVVVASAHRAAAFDACRWLIDTLKRTVPIWKKEYFEDGAVWADGEPFPEEIRGQLPSKPASK